MRWRELMMAAVLMLVAFVSQRAWADDARVEYVIDVRETATQTIHVSATFRDVSGPELRVFLPVWRPGRYEVLDPAGTVREVQARVGAEDRTIRKVEKSAWVVELGAGAARDVTVSYRLYANSLGDRTRHLDDSHAFISPSAVLMYTPEMRSLPCSVRIVAPDGWRVASGLDAQGGEPWVLGADGYDTLADSPIEVGKHDRIEFVAAGKTHEVIVWWGGVGEAGEARPGLMYKPEQIAADFAKIVEEQVKVFGSVPYERYVFLLHCYAGGRGGTEHVNSTIIQCGPGAFQSVEAYRRLLSLTSHEMFHTWNVKQFRPVGIKPYDYQRENYTELLWVAEGTTSYYEDLMLVRAKLLPVDEYLKALGRSLDADAKRPGARVQSLMESSFDSWIKFAKQNPDSVNTTVSFYDRGALVSWLLDMEIRGATDGRASADVVMKALFDRYPLAGPAYSPEDVERISSDAAERDLGAFFAKYVRGTEVLDAGPSLALAGLETVRTPEKGPDERVMEAEPTLGITIDTKVEPPAVAAVLRGGTGTASGVLAGDVLVAIDGQRVRGSDWPAMVKRLTPGTRVSLVVFRMDVLREIEIEVGAIPSGTLNIRRVEKPTDAQKAFYEAWLGQPWPEKK